MKKPTIEVLWMDMPTDKLVVNGGMVDVDEAYSDMIDALMQGLDDTLDFGEIEPKTEEMFIKALRKAGCEL